jgi:hypothetical protein
VVTGLLAPGSLEVTSQYLYWVQAVHPASDLTDAEIWRLPLGGVATDAVPIVTGVAKGINDRQWASDDVHVYWKDNAVLRAPADGLGGTGTETMGSAAEYTTLALDATHVYWTANGVYRRSKTATGVEQMASLGAPFTYISGIDVAPDAVLVTADSALARVDKTTLRISYLADVDAGTAFRPTLGNGVVYWLQATNHAPPSGIHRAAYDGSTPAELVVTGGSIAEFEVSAAGLVWRTGNDIQILPL